MFLLLAKFYEDKKSIAMLSIKYLISSVLGLKLCTKNKFINWIVNNILFEGNLTCVLRT